MSANFQYNTTNIGAGQQGSTAYGGGGGMNGSEVKLAGFRNILDARRAMPEYAKTPGAQYPDGYLGSIVDRRSDKMMQAVRNNVRSYTRGVHKGSRIERQDYFWTKDFNMETGLQFQAQGKKWTASGSPTERLVYSDGFMSQAEEAQLREELNLPVDPQMRGSLDPNVKTAMRKNLPGWR